MPSCSVSPPLTVACLCARWCRTCEDYRNTLRKVENDLKADNERAAPSFIWIDIEDEAELVGDIEIENFPTLLIARGEEALFFGAVTPDAQTLTRLIRAVLQGRMLQAANFPTGTALLSRLASPTADG